MSRAAFLPVLLCLPLLAACTPARDDGYPRLQPLDRLLAPPDLPAHAADAVADPSLVASELRARAAAAETHAAATAAAVTDAAALERRAAALRARAREIRGQETSAAEPPDCAAGTTNCAPN